MLRSVLVAIGVFHGAVALAQLLPSPGPPPPPGAGQNGAKYTVSGTVVNAITEEPIRRALVRLNGPVPAASFTDESGRFQFDNIPGGNAWINAEKPGFFQEGNTPGGRPVGGGWSFYTPSGRSSFGSTQNFSIGPSSKDIQIKMTPEARIEGRITDSDGEPLAGIQVQAMGEQIVEGRKQAVGFSMATTTGNGHYLIGGLVPGTYFVHTLLHPVFGDQRFGQMVARNYPLAYPSRYFPDSVDRASAQAQDLKGGGDAEADFTLTPQQTFRISGTVAGAQNFLNIFLGEPGGALPAHHQFDPRTNRFAVNLVSPGTWTLHFSSADTQGNQYSATAEATVSGSDVDGLQVVLQPDGSIPIEIRSGGAGPPAGSEQVQVQLIPKDAGTWNRRYMGTAREGGSSGENLIRNVPPGTYRVTARGFGSGCVESITSGSASLLRDDLVVNGGAPPAPITVTLRNDCAKIMGVVHSSTGTAPGTILLVPNSSAGDPIVIQTQPDGSFTDNLLSPGSYHVYAFANLGNLEYANPDALRDYSGQDVSLEPNQPISVNLDLIERKE